MPMLFNYHDPSAEIATHHGPILSNLNDSEWDKLIGCMERKLFPPGARILAAGARDRTLYFVVAGTVNVVVDRPKGPVQVASITGGSVFGEISFFDGEPRSAHVFAQDQVEVLSLRAERLEHLVAWHPCIAHKLLMELGRVMSQRLRQFYAE